MSAPCHSRPVHRSKQHVQEDRLAAVLPIRVQRVIRRLASALANPTRPVSNDQGGYFFFDLSEPLFDFLVSQSETHLD